MHHHQKIIRQTTFQILLPLLAVGLFVESSVAQFGYGIRGAGGLRANGIVGAGGLGGSTSGSGLGGRGLGMYRSPLTQSVRGGFGNTGSFGTRAKPFSSYTSAPTVSPYLNLFRVDLGSGDSNFNYSTLVQPQLQQQATNSQLQRQESQTNRRIQSLAAQADFNPQGAKDQYPTGHQTVFNYMGHYFPPAQARQKRQR